MKLILLFGAFVAVIARPEPPRGRFQSPSPPFLRQQLPRQEYGAPQRPVYGPPPLQPEITKSVFVHLPPPDTDYLPPPPNIPVQPPKKHYKLIFIKAPEPPKITPPIIPPQPQDEHKTLVYVLVKKPDEQPQIELPVPESTPPSKPEVYFIKYKENKKQTSYEYPPPSQYGPPPSEYGTPATQSPQSVDENYLPAPPPPSPQQLPSENEALAF